MRTAAIIVAVLVVIASVVIVTYVEWRDKDF